jgi:hypothetical protein
MPQQRVAPAEQRSVVVTDSMTVRDLARALVMSPATVDAKLCELGEITESEEDLCVTSRVLCGRSTVPQLQQSTLVACSRVH